MNGGHKQFSADDSEYISERPKSSTSEMEECFETGILAERGKILRMTGNVQVLGVGY